MSTLLWTLWAVMAVLILTRASVLAPWRESFSRVFSVLTGLDQIEAIQFTRCPMCLGLWICLVFALLSEISHLALYYLTSVLFVAVYDWLQPKDA